MNKTRVVYYELFKLKAGTKRLAKVDAILIMGNPRRGIVEKATITPLDNVFDTDLIPEFERAEIGKFKNIISCYEVETQNS